MPITCSWAETGTATTRDVSVVPCAIDPSSAEARSGSSCAGPAPWTRWPLASYRPTSSASALCGSFTGSPVTSSGVISTAARRASRSISERSWLVTFCRMSRASGIPKVSEGERNGGHGDEEDLLSHAQPLSPPAGRRTGTPRLWTLP